jgi:hypothetical protein
MPPKILGNALPVDDVKFMKWVEEEDMWPDAPYGIYDFAWANLYEQWKQEVKDAKRDGC